MAARFHKLEVSGVRLLTDDAVAVAFDVPPALVDEFRFQPGQYLTLRATIDGRDERRSYSICSAAGESFVEVGIKRVPDGVFSTFAQSLVRGQTLDVMTPQGRFVLDPDNTKHALLIAAGSGITPCLSMLKSMLEDRSDSRVTLIYGNRGTESIMFREDLAALKDRYTSRFSLLHVLSRERQDASIFNGRIDAAKIRDLCAAGLIDPLAMPGIYCCGPQAMTESVTDAFQALGTPLERIHVELFTTGDNQPEHGKSRPSAIRVSNRSTTESTQSADSQNAEVSITYDGSERTLYMDPARETVIDAASRSGLDLPFSCQGGMCCTCRCKVIQGEVNMDVNFSLAQWEIDAGFTLACQSRPVSSKLVLDFDAT